MSTKSAVVVLSGGQDSATCLALASTENDEVRAITFEYGQRHLVEIDCANYLGRYFNVVEHRFIAVNMLRDLVNSAMFDPSADIAAKHGRLTHLPASFVPARNAIFLTLAHAYANEVGAQKVYSGVCQTDYSGYPDCREEFVVALEAALNIGYESQVALVTPMMHMTKAQTFAMAEDLGVLDVILDHTNTCYNGDRHHRWDWGYGCGECPACILRKKGWEAFRFEEPLREQL